MGGKSSAPPAPDYRAAAEETAAGNLANARYATQANRPNEITPYGSKTWTNNRVFDQAGYDAALQRYNASLANAGTPYNGSGSPTGESQDGTASGGPKGQPMQAPNRDDFYTGEDNWTSTISLDPRAQQTLDKQFDLNDKYADLASLGLDKAWSTLSDPTLDMSKIPQRAINPGQTAQEAILARLNPQFAQQEEALRTRLANQGISAGSEAFGNDFRNFNQKRNDAELQAALLGINLDNQNRASALQEQAYVQDRPLNLINALKTGAQVQNPQFGGFAQQATTAGPNYSQAASQQYDAALDATNAQNAAGSGLAGGLFSLGSSFLGMPGAGKLFGF